MALGIAMALRATMMGLVTAIPSLIAWCYYSKKVENLAVEMAAGVVAANRRSSGAATDEAMVAGFPPGSDEETLMTG